MKKITLFLLKLKHSYRLILRLLIIGGIAFTLSGIGIMVLALATSHWNFKALTSATVETHVYTEQDGAIEILDLDLINTSVDLVFSPTAECVKVEYQSKSDANGNGRFETTVKQNGKTLTVEEARRPGFSVAGWFNVNLTATVTLPQGRSLTHVYIDTDNGSVSLTGNAVISEYLHVSTDNGSITAEDLSVRAASLETDNGRVSISGTLTATNVSIETDNGEITVKDTAIENEIALQTNLGRITVQGRLEARSAALLSDAGEINAQLISAQSVTLSSDVGSITATLEGTVEDYTIRVQSGVGSCNVSDRDGGTRTANLSCDVGSIRISFI